MEMKDVMIMITGSQRYGSGADDHNTMQLVTDGQYCYSDGETTLTYMESELTGLEGTKTSFTVRPESVVLAREGTVNSRMVFEEGKKHTFLYQKPMGAATMGVDTSRIRTSLGEHGGYMEVDYTVDVDHSVVGRNQFKIQVKEPQKGDVRWQI